MQSKWEEQTIHRQQVFKGNVVDLYVDTVRLPNGKEGKRELILHGGAVCILIVNKDNQVVLVRQFRKALESDLLEIPAGKMEKGEVPEETVKREMNEEVGYTCTDVKLVYQFYGCPGFCNEHVYLYEAINPEITNDKLALDEDEFLEVVTLDIQDALDLLKSGKIRDGKTIIALQYLQSKYAK